MSSEPRPSTTITREYFEAIFEAARGFQRAPIAVPPFIEFDVVRGDKVVTLAMGDEVLPTDLWNGLAVSAQLDELVELRVVLLKARRSWWPWSRAA